MFLVVDFGFQILSGFGSLSYLKTLTLLSLTEDRNQHLKFELGPRPSCRMLPVNMIVNFSSTKQKRICHGRKRSCSISNDQQF